MSGKKANQAEIEAFETAAEAGRDKEALAILDGLRDKVNQLNPAQKAAIFYHEGRILERAGDLLGAEEAFTKLFHEGLKRRQSYNQTLALHNLGWVYTQMDHYTESINSYRQALRILNSHMENYQSLLSRNYLGQGDCFRAAGDNEEAAMYYELALAFAESIKDNKQCEEARSKLSEVRASSARTNDL
ncbi:MAG: tetratricopeptide repeat protein [Eubacteriales bacterium]|nr:tetratricopeptide repeat protein [Eubacteriales bacterium]